MKKRNRIYFEQKRLTVSRIDRLEKELNQLSIAATDVVFGLKKVSDAMNVLKSIQFSHL